MLGCPCRWDATACCRVALMLVVVAWAQDLRPWISNPVARHTACPVAPSAPTVCTLWGEEDLDLPLIFRISALPTAGYLYETSGNFRTFGTDPKNMPDPIGPHLLPFLVTDPLHRIVYVPPFNVWPPEGHWSSFTYTVQVNVSVLSLEEREGKTFPASEPGLVVMTNPEGAIAASTFDAAGDGDGWSISGNYADIDATSGGLRHQAFAWGALNRYVSGVDEVQFLDFGSGLDRSKWYFEGSPREFHGSMLQVAYGGRLRFTVRSLYGNFSELNSPLDWVTLECASCNSNQGARIVRFVDESLRWDGSERLVELKFHPVERWMRDPLNSALDFTFASECEIAAILSNVSRMAILGDFTRRGEGVAIDDVAIYQPIQYEMPAFPVQCQKGCPCRHNQGLVRPSCC